MRTLLYLFYILLPDGYLVFDVDTDGVEVIECHITRLCFPFYCAMLSGLSEFPTY